MTINTAVTKLNEIIEGEHMIGKFVGVESGVSLIVVGSVHGNEPSGVIALQKISREMESLKNKLRGRVYFLAGNTRALNRRVRFIETDLNRHWTSENVEKNNINSVLQIAEDKEQSELLKILNEILRTANDDVFALDLHSTSAAGLPFATVGDTLRNRHFAQKFPVIFLLGIEEQLDGTMLEYLNNRGVVTLGFEGGQHESSQAIENHEGLVWLSLVNSGILAAEDVPDLKKYQQNLLKASGKPRIVEVRYRQAITENEDFEMNQGYSNFQTVRRNEVLAKDKNGEIRAKESGLILMPLYQKQGEDGFFIGREVAPFWLWLSEILRNWNIADWIHFLPGVSYFPSDPDTLFVNTRVARFFPLQIFHLLGFRKLRWRENNLVVSRRRLHLQILSTGQRK